MGFRRLRGGMVYLWLCGCPDKSEVSMSWFFIISNLEFGPFGAEEMLAKLREGIVNEKTLCRPAGGQAKPIGSYEWQLERNREKPIHLPRSVLFRSGF